MTKKNSNSYSYSTRYDTGLLTSPSRSLQRPPADTSSRSSPLRFDSSLRSCSSAHVPIDSRESRYSSYLSQQTLAERVQCNDVVSEHIQCSDVEENVIHIKSRPLPRGGVTKSIPFCPTVVEELRVGMRVSVNRGRPMLSRGTVKWTGTLPSHTGDYVGVELDVESGKHDGVFNGVQYFRCKKEKGIFVKLSKVIMAWK